MRSVENLELKSLRGAAGVHSPRTPAHLASDELARLQLLNHAIEFCTPADAAADSAVLTPEQQSALSARHSAKRLSEAELVSYLTPLLHRWLCEGGPRQFRCLVNSEAVVWLPMAQDKPQFDRKPDLWLGPYFLATAELPGESAMETAAAAVADHAARDYLYVFGRPSSVDWHDACFPLAAKNDMTNEAVGQLMEYLIALSSAVSRPEHVSSRGMAFGVQGFHLLEAQRGVITHSETGKWTQGGSGPRLRTFFSVASAWELGVEYFCEQLQVLPVRALGAGAFGRVIEVERRGADPSTPAERLALKVVLGADVYRLVVERLRLSSLLESGQSSGSPLELRSVLPSCVEKLQVQPGGAGSGALGAAAAAFLLQPVGERLLLKTLLSKSDDFALALRALHTLHAHGQTHGDPRLPNLLRRVAAASDRQLRATVLQAPNRAGVWNPQCDLVQRHRQRLQTGGAAGDAACASPASESSSALAAVVASSPAASHPPAAATSGNCKLQPAGSLFWIDFAAPNVAAERNTRQLGVRNDLLLFLCYLCGVLPESAQGQSLAEQAAPLLERWWTLTQLGQAAGAAEDEAVKALSSAMFDFVCTHTNRLQQVGNN